MSMAYSDNGPEMEVGNSLTEDAANVFDDAVNAISPDDMSEQDYIREMLSRVRQGQLGIYTLSACHRTVGVICYRILDGDAELIFGHLLAAAGDRERFFLERTVNGLFNDGAHTVRGNFTWPRPAGFIKAANAMGFIVTERMSMGLRPSPVSQPKGQFGILPWNDDYAEEVSQIMSVNSSPADRPIYPMFSRPEGAKMLMESVLNDRHGKLLRELSYVSHDGKDIIGFLLSTLLADGSVLILNIAVDERYRKRGIGGVMIDRLVSDSYRSGYRQILLAVTSTNYDAIRLYEHKGFKVNGHFRQFVLSKLNDTG
jgi:ribosomal protein S18 acetylase RimI-like enzyme